MCCRGEPSAYAFQATADKLCSPFYRIPVKRAMVLLLADAKRLSAAVPVPPSVAPDAGGEGGEVQ